MAEPLDICWGAKVSEPFLLAVLRLAHDLDWNERQASYLMACMHFETGGTFSPTIRNAAGSGAIGLIQFMPRTAEGLGTTTYNLSQMSDVGQLGYVKRYFRPYAARCISLADMYMAILMPRYVGAPEDAVLFSGGIAYRQNSGLDANRDGRITKKEAASKVTASYLRGMREGNCRAVLPRKPVGIV